MSKNGHFRGKKYHALGGEVWDGVHPESLCATETCVIHNPSQHKMRQWEMHLQRDGMVVRICEHGVLHPDPDSAAYMHERWGGDYADHFCDGCCGMEVATVMPTPECEYGYTEGQIAEIMGDRLAEFHKWMYGQTMTLCEGKSYNHETREYEVSCGGISHGGVTYLWDVRRFLDGLPVID